MFICPQVPVHNLTPSLNTLIIPPPPVPSYHMATGALSYYLLMRNSIGGWQIKGQTALLKENEC